MQKLIILFIFITSLFSDPFNETKIIIDLNSSKPTLTMQFMSFNIEKPLKIDDASEKVVIKNRKRILDYIQKHIKIEKCELTPIKFGVRNSINTKIIYQLKCSKNRDYLNIKFNLFFDFDKTQSGITKIITENLIQTIIFKPSKESYNISLNEKISTLKYFKLFVIEGIWHIWKGIDHILFLLMLIVPSVIIFKHSSFWRIFKEILKIVTAFTISHSITLSLSMFKIVEPNERIIETLIAFSVLVTALLNIKKVIKIKTWLLAFIFGFIHGFGFANVLKELELPAQNFLATLFGFNIGVEIGQIIIVFGLLPIIYIARNRIFYNYFITFISICVAIISILWMIDRWFQLNFMPF